MTAILAVASSSLTVAVIPGTQRTTAKDSEAPKKKTEPEKIQAAHGPVSAPATGINPEPRDPASAAELFPTLLLMRRVFDLNIGAYDSELGTPTPESIPVKWPAWEDVYFNRETYRAKLEELVSMEWAVGPNWWNTRVTVACEHELDRGGPILFILDYSPVILSENLVIEVVKETVRETSGEIQRTVVRVKQGAYAVPADGRQGSLVPLAPILILASILGIVLVFLLLNMLFRALAKTFFPDQWENPWVRRFLACCIGAAILIIITVARLAI